MPFCKALCGKIVEGTDEGKKSPALLQAVQINDEKATLFKMEAAFLCWLRILGIVLTLVKSFCGELLTSGFNDNPVFIYSQEQK